jgi:hypothetical protein
MCYISESRLHTIINDSIKSVLYEGIDWSKNDDGSINLSINQDKSDRANSGKNSVDTRVFGTKDDILHGDNTANGNVRTLDTSVRSKLAAIQFYKDVIEFVKNGRKEWRFDIPEDLDEITMTSVSKWFEEGKSDNWIIDAATKAINRIESASNPQISTHNRVSSSSDERIARYTTGTVGGTNVKYIALFTMSDFNFSDAIKHGYVRQNSYTDNILGISRHERDGATGKKNDYSTIDVTYDGKHKPDISQNFSLNGVVDGHYKQQFGLNGEGGYSSISQFLDKSVNYAAYALKKEKFIPDYIIAPPSSSKFNKYYCTNLSNKLGIPYREDFFQRNLINVRFDKDKDAQSMIEKGFSPKDVMEFENQVKNVAYKEIAYFVSEPIRKLVYENQDLFGNISLGLHSREKTSIEDVFDCVMTYVYQTIIKSINSGEDAVEKHLVNNFISGQNKLYNKSYDSRHIYNQVLWVIKLKIGKRVFNQYMLQVYNLVKQYSDLLKEKGYTLRFDSKRVKVTQFKKQFRPFLRNVYIIADKYLTNGEFMKQYKNAKFLIFDEDINSGATLKLCIDALQEKLPDTNQNNIMCLVNAYSASGW